MRWRSPLMAFLSSLPPPPGGRVSGPESWRGSKISRLYLAPDADASGERFAFEARAAGSSVFALDLDLQEGEDMTDFLARTDDFEEGAEALSDALKGCQVARVANP